jgi:hypothetical protein
MNIVSQDKGATVEVVGKGLGLLITTQALRSSDTDREVLGKLRAQIFLHLFERLRVYQVFSMASTFSSTLPISIYQLPFSPSKDAHVMHPTHLTSPDKEKGVFVVNRTSKGRFIRGKRYLQKTLFGVRYISSEA